ncbi:MAG: 3-oxoacyl-ACP synthase III family protein [Maribacter sp.]|nr:3-oxoacyl-ACP synthase III family protein [Maribacter sp.]
MGVAITGTGSFLPPLKVENSSFANHTFLNSDGSSIDAPNSTIIEKFKSITGIGERRYARNDVNTSELGYFASLKAIEDAGIDKESLDYIIFAHNFGDITYGKTQSDMLPSLATRVKHSLGIKNPKCVAYDMLFGCPGWIEGTIQANAFIKSGIADKCLVIGAETLSRVVDDYDRDSMIYSDGAGAAIIERSETGGEIVNHTSATYANGEAYFLFYGDSYKKESEEDRLFIKMYGRKIYEFAITHVPQAMKDCLDKSGRDISEVKKIFIHQANEKMDEAIVNRFYQLYGLDMPLDIMPMNIEKLGNSSVATVPTLFDMVKHGQMANHAINEGDLVMFASVGAGMNINAIVYQI